MVALKITASMPNEWQSLSLSLSLSLLASFPAKLLALWPYFYPNFLILLQRELGRSIVAPTGRQSSGPMAISARGRRPQTGRSEPRVRQGNPSKRAASNVQLAHAS